MQAHRRNNPHNGLRILAESMKKRFFSFFPLIRQTIDLPNKVDCFKNLTQGDTHAFLLYMRFGNNLREAASLFVIKK